VAKFFLESEVFQIQFVKNFKTHILSSITFFFPENGDVYEIMGKNILGGGGGGRPHYDDMAHAHCMLDN